MTYIELINEFWRQDAIKPFGAADTRLYMYLLHQCNIRGWLNPFELSTRNLELTMGVTRKMIQESKKRLKQRGLIDYIDGSRSKTPVYTITVVSDTRLSPRNISENTIGNILGNVTQNTKETQAETPIKTKTKDKDLKENPYGVKEKHSHSPIELIGEYRRTGDNPDYLRFLDWLERSAPYVARHIKPLSQDEFERLKNTYGSKSITVNIHNIENRKDLRKKYTSLYRTLINWCQKG